MEKWLVRGYRLSVGPLGKHLFTSMSSKGHGLWFVIGGFQSFRCASVFQCLSCDHNLLWLMAAKKCNRPIILFQYIRNKTKINVLFISEPQDDSFVLFHQALGPNMNFHAVYWNWSIVSWILNFRVLMLLKSVVSYFTPFCSKVSLWSQPEVALNFLSPLNKAFTL